jgi:hypothetical protein
MEPLTAKFPSRLLEIDASVRRRYGPVGKPGGGPDAMALISLTSLTSLMPAAKAWAGTSWRVVT